MPTTEPRVPEVLATLLFCALMAVAGLALVRPRVSEVPVSPSLAPLTDPRMPVVRVFDDFECAACGAFDRRVAARLHALEAEGRLRIEYHHTPLAVHTRSRHAAAAVACAPARERATIRSRLHRHREWAFADDPAAAVLEHVPRGSAEEVAACMGQDSIAALLAADAAFGRRAAIRAVPTVWLDGRHLRFRTWRSLVRHIEESL
jgi:protein-disulfide isomerase